MSETQSVNFIQVAGPTRPGRVDPRAEAVRALGHAVESCLANGVSPREIMAAVGKSFWAKVKVRAGTGAIVREWPLSPRGGWSDDPMPGAETRGSP